MRHPELLPTLVCTLPNGLGVYRSRFQDVTGSNLVFGGPYASPENVDHEEARTMLLQTYELMSQLPQPEEDLVNFLARVFSPSYSQEFFPLAQYCNPYH